MRKKQWFPLCTLLLFVLMLGCILGMVALGSGLYGRLVQSSQQNSDSRASLSYVAARLRAADEQSAVSVQKTANGDVLILAEPQEDTGFETRIYLNEGCLVEEYAPTGSALSPAAAQVVAHTDAFAVQLSGALATITTGEGEAHVALHAAGKAAS